MNNRRLISLVFGFFLLSISSAHAMLINAGFETGDATGWTVGGTNGGFAVAADGTAIAGTHSIFVPAFQNVRSGSFGAHTAVADGAGEFLSLSQTVNLAGGMYSTGFFMGNDSNNVFGFSPAIDSGRLGIFLDGMSLSFDGLIISNFEPGSLASDMREFTAMFSTTAGMHTIEYRISGSGSGRAGISVDDFFLTGNVQQQLPEPNTLFLIGLPLLALWVRQRLTRA